MFNFKFQQKAFEELNAEQFRIVYLLNSTLSMINKTNKTPKNHKLEIFNGYLMDKLGLSERQVQRLIKRLEQLNYITVERATRKNQPNIITLIFEENNATDCTLSQNNDKNDAINCDINCDKNVTLNKEEIKINKYNITKDFSTYGNSTCREKDITKWTKVFNENNNNVTKDTLQLPGVISDEENKKYKTKNINMKKSNSVKSNLDNIIQSDDVNNINSDELFNLDENVDMSDEVCVLGDDFDFKIWISKWNALKGEVLEANRNNNIEQFKRSLNDMLDCLSELKLKGNRYYDYNCKDAISFVNSNSVVFDGDFLFAGGDFRRAVERRA